MYVMCDVRKDRVSVFCTAYLWQQAENVRRKASGEMARTVYETLNQRQEHGHFGMFGLTCSVEPNSR